MNILTTYPIPEVARWSERTALVTPRRLTGFAGLVSRVLNPLGVRDVTFPFRLLRLRHRYDVFITGAEREDCMFAVLQSLLGGRNIPHLMMCCLWKQERHPIKGWVKRRLVRLMSRSVTRFIVWSSEEIENYSRYFGIDRRKFIFVPHHATLNGYGIQATPGTYVFAGGDSSRDYTTLIEAVRALKVPVVIASTNPRWKRAVRGLAHVQVQTVSARRFRELMAGARVVVVPLDTGILQSAGQQTYLNAMQLGKPVIVSDAPGVRDYIRDGATGWIVPAGDALALRQAIERILGDGVTVRHVVKTASAEVVSEFSVERFVERNLQAAEAVLNSNGSAR